MCDHLDRLVGRQEAWLFGWLVGWQEACSSECPFIIISIIAIIVLIIVRVCRVLPIYVCARCSALASYGRQHRGLRRPGVRNQVLDLGSSFRARGVSILGFHACIWRGDFVPQVYVIFSFWVCDECT